MKDNCILCGKETQFNKNCDIKDRLYYIDGFGQLCDDCYEFYLNNVNYIETNTTTDDLYVKVSVSKIKETLNDYELGVYVRSLSYLN